MTNLKLLKNMDDGEFAKFLSRLEWYVINGEFNSLYDDAEKLNKIINEIDFGSEERYIQLLTEEIEG